MSEEGTSVEPAKAVEYGEYEVDADVGNVPSLLIWIFVGVLLWGIFSWVPFFGGVEGSQW